MDETSASKRDASSGSQPHACVASTIVSASFAEAARSTASTSATAPFEDWTALKATTSVSSSTASASALERHGDDVEPLLVDEEREEQRREVDLGDDDPRAVRHGRSDDADER